MKENLKPVLILALAIMIFSCRESEQRLPLIPDGVKQTMVNGKPVIDTAYKTIPDFSFLNQDSITVTNKDFDGKIYVADFFFTSCPTICPIMHRNLLKVYEKYKGNPDVMLLSHTIDYRYDIPSRLKAYRSKLGADGKQWQFVWGIKDIVYRLAEKDYLVSVNEDKASPGGYVHQGYLVLIDKHRRVRGAYDGTQTDQVDQLMKDMDILLKEK
ncbi:SCO family protein [Pedobacter zeae]|uniref:Protein SCO1/2 n=1 Tax=Pedobacter zeae TaxID=1737356 RepID=A0A7W6P6X5_9SPHI|nr:SCO family protein [Pedobacter zeae]MBB4109642.1 protein SCO1/2 [Pedobacter zeae]GGH13398.1 SCO family protein [Pedobacter zeae]